MAKNVGATLSLKDGNFFANVKSAMSETGKLKEKLTGAGNSLNKTSKNISGVGNTLTSGIKKVVGFVAAYASVHQIVSFSKECIDAANAQAAAETRLEKTMSNVTGTTQVQIDAIKKYSSELQSMTSVGDEVTIHGASQLATFQLQSDTIKTLLPSLQDLAVSQYGVSVSSEQMQSMANLMGKVMTGSVSALTRYGVTMNDTQKKILQSGNESERAAMLVSVLEQNFGGLAEAMANTPEGRVQQLKNAWGDMQEVIGAKLYPVITRVLTYATDKIPSVQTKLEGIFNKASELGSGFMDNVMPKIDSFAEKIEGAGKVAYDMAKFVIDNWNLIGPVIGGIAAAVTTYKLAVMAVNIVTGIQIAATTALNIVTGAFGAIMTFVTSPIGIVVAVIGILVAAFVYCWNRFEGFRNFWISAWDVIKNGASAAWGGIKAVFSAISTVVSTVFGAMKATVTQKLGNIKNAYTSHGGGVKGVVFAYMEGVKSFYTAGLTFVDNLTGGKLTAIKDKFISGFNTVKESVVNAFTSIRDKIKGIWDNIKSFFKMPTIEVVGTVTIAGFDTPIPKLGVKWNAQGGIMTRPTIFGVNGNNFLGGGEKGAEAILPLSVLWDKLERFLAPQRAAVPVRANNNVINVNVYSNNEDDATLADKVAEKILEILDNM